MFFCYVYAQLFIWREFQSNHGFHSLKILNRLANTRSPHICSPLISAGEWNLLSFASLFSPLRTVGCLSHARTSLVCCSDATSVRPFQLSYKSESGDWAHACLPQSMINKPISLAQRNKWDNHIYQAHTRTTDTVWWLREVCYKLKKKEKTKFIFVYMACDKVSLAEGSLNTIEWNYQATSNLRWVRIRSKCNFSIGAIIFTRDFSLNFTYFSLNTVDEPLYSYNSKPIDFLFKFDLFLRC